MLETVSIGLFTADNHKYNVKTKHMQVKFFLLNVHSTKIIFYICERKKLNRFIN